ncbi:MAG: hypothetical protein LiPW15_243 [Parcubacteria group bacterium LiPW_15]|nr:MAG: hypothetical protein LiPW15_243 [Parcubacteria group bacterium LiPW_15]
MELSFGKELWLRCVTVSPDKISKCAAELNPRTEDQEGIFHPVGLASELLIRLRCVIADLKQELVMLNVNADEFMDAHAGEEIPRELFLKNLRVESSYELAQKFFDRQAKDEFPILWGMSSVDLRAGWKLGWVESLPVN